MPGVRTRVKICSVCSPQDAETAVSLGADAIGLIFHPASKRYVDLDLARQIVGRVPAYVSAVGVFVDAGLDTVAQTVRALRLPCVQLHGQETPAYAQQLAHLNVRFVKAIKSDKLKIELELWRGAARSLGEAFAGLVLESPGPAPGGSGVPNDWPAIRRLIDSGAFEGLPPLIAAGGITPETAFDIVRLIRPWAVDVSSGVEAELRRKDRAKMALLMAEVRWADETGSW
jgi:phosphoribosylanthranilate isomerase